MKKWTDEEILILKNNEKKSLEELSILLSNRTINSIKLKRLKLGMEKFRKKWTIEELEILKKYGNNCLNKDLKILLPERSLHAIESQIRDMGIYKKLELKISHGKRMGHLNKDLHYKLDQTIKMENLDNITYQILIGSLLGDGSITNQNRNEKFIFKEGHGISQFDYLVWKHTNLGIFKPNKVSYKNNSPIFSTPSHPIFDL